MWRKITSNRDPRDTIYSELKKEFSPFVGKANGYSRDIAERYPKCIFGCMIALMLASATLGLTVFRHHPPAPQSVQVDKGHSPIQDSYSQLMSTVDKIGLTIQLKNRIDSITAKTQMTPADTIMLNSALNQLERINPPNPPGGD
jgi:hypothetical protein